MKKVETWKDWSLMDLKRKIYSFKPFNLLILYIKKLGVVLKVHVSKLIRFTVKLVLYMCLMALD